MATSRDPAYLADAARVKVPVEPVDAEAVEQAIDRLSAASPQLFDYVRKLMAANKGGG
jgi:hypothetical protein